MTTNCKLRKLNYLQEFFDSRSNSKDRLPPRSCDLMTSSGENFKNFKCTKHSMKDLFSEYFIDFAGVQTSLNL